MRSPALLVDRERAEAVRRRLSAGNWLRRDLVPLREGAQVAFPVQGLPERMPPGIEGTLGDREFASVAPGRVRDYREGLDLPAPLQAELPSSFDVIGDLVLIRLPDALLPYRERIGQALLQFVPGCRKVGLDLGVHGEARVRHLEPLAGEGSWATVHRENRLSFSVDVEHAYFSPRLAREHARVAEASRNGERLLDLFCGVGPFALTALRRHPGLRAVAVDLNPFAIELLRSNAQRLKVADRLEAREERAETFLRRPERFQRAVMNLPREGYMYVVSVARLVTPGGTLHHYEVLPREGVPARREALLRELHEGSGGPWTLEAPHVVHPYSPSSDLVAWTAVRGG